MHHIKVYSFQESQPLIIAFGGLAGELGIPRFEFLKIASTLPASKVFIRDPYQAWYQFGISPQINTVNKLAQSIQTLIVEPSKAPKVLTIGNSAGGYAALLFGCLIKADVILAFSPQTYIERNGWKKEDGRFGEQIQQANLTRNKSFLNLRPLVANNLNADINVYACLNHALDLRHAMRLHQLPQTKLHLFNEGGHGLANRLKETGQLKDIISKALQC